MWLQTTRRDVITDIKNEKNNVTHTETKQKTEGVDGWPIKYYIIPNVVYF